MIKVTSMARGIVPKIKKCAWAEWCNPRDLAGGRFTRGIEPKLKTVRYGELRIGPWFDREAAERK